MSFHPTEFILRNILCITLKFIREEAEKLAHGENEEIHTFDTLVVG
jgi:hypothetical protein